LEFALGSDPLDLQTLSKADDALVLFYKEHFKKGNAADSKIGPELVGPGLSIVRACSEALFFSVLACFKAEIPAYKAVRENLHPCGECHFASKSKLLLSVLMGGKTFGSQVKFARFYLIVDGHANTDVNIPLCFMKFLAALRKSFAGIKGGEAVFKIGPEGAYFNAFTSINETFKQFEEAIAQSGANGAIRPASQAKSVSAPTEGESEAAKSKPVFKIGINCDADTLFNKDPKDPNKYECEANKVQQNSQQMCDYYINMCKDHPLLEYIEDPFAENDANGYRLLKTALHDQYPHVQIGLLNAFKECKIEKVQQVTRPKSAEQLAEEEKQKEALAQRPPTQEEKKKAPPAKGQPAETVVEQQGPLYFLPHLVSLRTGSLVCLSQLMDFFKYISSLGIENQFGLIFDDKIFEDQQSDVESSGMDLAFGLGCEYFHVKGVCKPERIAKVYAYAEMIRNGL